MLRERTGMSFMFFYTAMAFQTALFNFHTNIEDFIKNLKLKEINNSARVKPTLATAFSSIVEKARGTLLPEEAPMYSTCISCCCFVSHPQDRIFTSWWATFELGLAMLCWSHIPLAPSWEWGVTALPYSYLFMLGLRLQKYSLTKAIFLSW